MAKALAPIGYAQDPAGTKRPVYDLFAEIDTHGIPLSVALATCHEHGVIFGWQAFIAKACKAGWNVPKKLAEWRIDVKDEYGDEYAAEWERMVLDYLTGPKSPLPTTSSKFHKSESRVCP